MVRSGVAYLLLRYFRPKHSDPDIRRYKSRRMKFISKFESKTDHLLQALRHNVADSLYDASALELYFL